MTLPFGERIQMSEESTFNEDLGKGDTIKISINRQKINLFTADGAINLMEVADENK